MVRHGRGGRGERPPREAAHKVAAEKRGSASLPVLPAPSYVGHSTGDASASSPRSQIADQGLPFLLSPHLT
jgi:hypothetical protein